MFDSASESGDSTSFLPAVLRRPKVANHIVHESFTVDTRDHEDHTFCGVMFDVECRSHGDGGVPLEYLEIDAISVRGELGPLTVWTTPDSFAEKLHDPASWDLVYQRTHEPSHREYTRLELDQPIRLRPGERRGLYVHSSLAGDEALVYDNQRSRVTYQDNAFKVYPGLAHLSNKPFGRRGFWGFPWRERREFVGRLSYGVCYKLWNPEVHMQFPADFRSAAEACLLCARRPESPLYQLQDEVVYYILNLCRYDWFSVPGANGNSSSAAADGRPRASLGESGSLRPSWALPATSRGFYPGYFDGGEDSATSSAAASESEDTSDQQ
eukprot:TRINITY_DN14022_c0_g4_i1.p1 TRINITY_DN14022_c0_g4~~TRINITY_DN14022_c0_g4_i1.p1  ORF type:complete len:325 (-),score=61.88 TRINITY_DN14022_c0_g4_i1:115-1089(-)